MGLDIWNDTNKWMRDTWHVSWLGKSTWFPANKAMTRGTNSSAKHAEEVTFLWTTYGQGGNWWYWKKSNSRLVHDGSSWSMTSARESLDGDIWSRAKQVGWDLRLSRPEQTVQSTLLFDIRHHISLQNRQNWWESLPMTVRSIRPNDTISKTVITITSETVDLRERRWLFCGCPIKVLIYENVDIGTFL